MRRILPVAVLLAIASACKDEPTPNDDEVGDSAGTTEDESTTAPAPDVGVAMDMGTTPVGCTVDPSTESTLFPGPQPDGSVILVNGRRTDTAGASVQLTGLGADVVLHPLLDIAYVATAGRNQRHLYAIDRTSQQIVQDLDRGEGFYGLAITGDGSRLYASNGVPGGVSVFDVDALGQLTEVDEVPAVGWTAGMALSPDASTLWVASFDANRITVIDTATLTITDTMQPGFPALEVLHLPGRNELWATEFADSGLAIVDLASATVVETLDLPTSPSMMVANADESRVFVSVSGADTVVAIDTATRQVAATTKVAEDDFVDAMGEPLPNSNPGALGFDLVQDRLYVARGSDSAIGVFDAGTLGLLGSIPTNWYPTALALSPDGGQLVVTEARATGSRTHLVPDLAEYRGGASFIDLDGLDLSDTTNTVVENFRRPLDNAAIPECGDDFPIPTDYSGSPVIEHVILIVNENKTFDSLFGDLGPALGVEADPAFLDWDPATTVNKRALAERFVIADNFYTDAEESDSGHTFLTATHWTDYVERIQKERDEYDVLAFYPPSEPAIPDRGNFFSWVIDNGKTLQVYGEIVGILADSSQGPIAQFADGNFPGGLVINYDVEDEVKAAYVAEQIAAGNLANFTFLSLPNDHGQGIAPGVPTPPSMVADTDYAVGLIVDAVSHSPFWDKTVIFVLQDDPQASDDHIDESRSPLQVISPWVRTGYVSHAHYSFPAVFATIERLLGLPPLGRPDAAAAPMYDMFTDVPNLEPYDAIPREYPKEFGSVSDPGVAATKCMDFRGPDRNPGLGVVYENWSAYKRGEITKEQADAAIAKGLSEPGMLSWAEEEAEEETFASAVAMEAYRELAPKYGWKVIEPPAKLGPDAGCPGVDDED
jgi:YVTN family beta-propeller protein